MSVFIKHLKKKDIKRLNVIFDEFDEDNTGMITPDEIRKALRKIGRKASTGEIEKIIKNVDYLGNGKINYSEFLAANIDIQKLLTEDKMR